MVSLETVADVWGPLYPIHIHRPYRRRSRTLRRSTVARFSAMEFFFGNNNDRRGISSSKRRLAEESQYTSLFGGAV